MVSKPAILAGQYTAWSEAGGSWVPREEEEESELGERMHLMEDKDGQHRKHLGQSFLVLAQKPSTCASDGTKALFCVLFLGSWSAKGWALIA